MLKTSHAEIKCWLESALKRENLSDFTISRTESSEKGDGYMGEIVFVDVSAKTKTHALKTYRLVLKYSKDSEALRKSMPIQAAFENEIYLYENVIPTFTDFQRKRGVSVFSSVPKYYGSYTDENREVLVLKNLKSEGYFLCDRKVPLPTKHLKLILQEYGKWHAISAAMQDQEPEKFRRLTRGRKNFWKLFADSTDLDIFFGTAIDEVHDLLKSDLCESTASKLKNFKSQITQIISNIIMDEPTCFSVINHGDCWNNNFMFKMENEDQNGSLEVAILDWQVTKLANPVMDVSYFLFACSSKKDLDMLDDLLKFYYDCFSNHVRLLKSDPYKIYSFPQFLEDFKLYGKFGVLVTFSAMKIALSDKEEAPDFAEIANEDFAQTFTFKNKNHDLLKNRMFYIVEKMAEQGIF